MRLIDALLRRVHVPKRELGGGRAASRGHVVPDHEPVRVLRVFDDRLPDRAVGDDRRGVPQTDQRHARWRGHMHRPFFHIHRAPDVPAHPGTGHQAGHVRRVWCRVLT